MARRHSVPTIPYRPSPAAGDAAAFNSVLHQQAGRDSEAALRQAEQTDISDPMRGMTIGNASQNAINTATDINGMATVLQGIKNAAGDKRRKVGFSEPSSENPSALMPASWNPAGSTEEAAQLDAKKYAQGGPLPEWFGGAAPDTQEAFRRRVLQGIARARG